MNERFAGCLLAVSCVSCGASGPMLTLERVQRDLLADESWRTLSAPADSPPTVAVITPSFVVGEDGSDRLALVMPPPSRVSFEVREGDGPVGLRTSCGVDFRLARQLAQAGADPLPVEFEILVDGRSVFRESVVTRPKLARAREEMAQVHHAWLHPGGGRDLQLTPGQEVELVTRLAGDLPEGVDRPRAGFADLLLMRSWVRAKAEASPERPNVVLVVMDTLRADRTSVHGYPRPTTPNLARLAERGLVYERAHATASWTWPATASILTGLEPEAHGVTSKFSCHLVHEIETLAECLQEVGVTCAAFTGNPLISPTRNFDQGFERFDAGVEFRNADRFVPDALRWMAENRGHRFFLYLHLVEPHTPYDPPPDLMREFCGSDVPAYPPDLPERLLKQLRERLAKPPADDLRAGEELPGAEALRWLSDAYDGEVAAGDRWLGALLDLLDELGIADRSVVAFTSDHGEELFEHGWITHSQSIHQELVLAPLVIAGPGVPVGERRARPVSNRHLAPTLARLAGARLAGVPDALDLARPLPAVTEPVMFETRIGIWGRASSVPILGLVQGDWALHLRVGPGAETPRDPGPPEEWSAVAARLFELARDPGERDDLAAELAERVRAMRELLEERFRDQRRRRPKSRSRAGMATDELLEQIGYGGMVDEPGR